MFKYLVKYPFQRANAGLRHSWRHIAVSASLAMCLLSVALPAWGDDPSVKSVDTASPSSAEIQASSTPAEHTSGEDSAKHTQQEESNIQTFAPSLMWSNANNPLLFPVHWVMARDPGIIIAGSRFSKACYTYDTDDGDFRGVVTLLSPCFYAPLFLNYTAIIQDVSGTMMAFNSHTGDFMWMRSSSRPPKRNTPALTIASGQNSTPLTSYGNKIVTMNSDGTVRFIPNDPPSINENFSILFLKTSPDEAGTFQNAPVIYHDVLYAVTNRGHLHYALLSDLSQRGLVKNVIKSANSSISREVRTAPLVAGRNIILATMDGTLHCYSQLRRQPSSQTYRPPKLLWRSKIAGTDLYQCYKWDQNVLSPIWDERRNAVYACSLDNLQAFDIDDGSVLWTCALPQRIACVPLLWGDLLIAITAMTEERAAQIVAIDTQTGQKIGSYDLPATPCSQPSLTGSTLAVGYRTGLIECYDLGELE